MRTVVLFLLCSCPALLLSCTTLPGNKSTASAPLSVPKERHLVTQTHDTPSAFDDMTEALKWRDSQCLLHQSGFDRTAIVRDYLSGEKIRVTDATYVKGSDVVTPSGGDIISFSERAAADDFAKVHGGQVFSYDELNSLMSE